MQAFLSKPFFCYISFGVKWSLTISEQQPEASECPFFPLSQVPATEDYFSRQVFCWVALCLSCSYFGVKGSLVKTDFKAAI